MKPQFTKENGAFWVDALTLDVPPLLGHLGLAVQVFGICSKPLVSSLSVGQRDRGTEREIAAVGFHICQILYVTCKQSNEFLPTELTAKNYVFSAAYSFSKPWNKLVVDSLKNRMMAFSTSYFPIFSFSPELISRMLSDHCTEFSNTVEFAFFRTSLDNLLIIVNERTVILAN